VAALAFASALAVANPGHASAADDFEIDLPAGTACPTFDLRVEATRDQRITREFTDQNGNVVRVLQAGVGFDLTFKNLNEPENTLELPSNGTVTRTTVNADGTTTVQSTGHNVLILFSTDVPAGPSTTLYTGRLVYTVDAEGVFTVLSTNGRTTDICVLLA
jgi:hypothetical protein